MKSLYKQQQSGYSDTHTIMAMDMDIWHDKLAFLVFGNHKHNEVYDSLAFKCGTVAHDFDAQYEDSLEQSVVKHF